jgi:hypothetical protein
MYGSNPKHGLKSALLEMYKEYAADLPPLDKTQLTALSTAIEDAVYDIIDIPRMREILYKD